MTQVLAVSGLLSSCTSLLEEESFCLVTPNYIRSPRRGGGRPAVRQEGPVVPVAELAGGLVGRALLHLADGLEVRRLLLFASRVVRDGPFEALARLAA